MQWWKYLTLLALWVVLVGAGALGAYVFRSWLPPVVAGVLVLVVVAWILGSVFSPAVPDRTCPRCGEDGLVRLRKGQMLGVRCVRCDFVDTEMYRAYLDEV